MKKLLPGYFQRTLILSCLVTGVLQLTAQTETDGIMMRKNNLCTGFMYSYCSWDHYWEGTLKRTNENLGTVSTQMIGWMGNYGITNKLNVLASLPYVITKPSAGTFHGMKGLQDVSLWLKWNAWEGKIARGNLRLMALGGFSFPSNNYIADYQPFAVGLKSKNLTGRIIADYEIHHFFATASAAYVYRSNIKIERSAYYDTQLHLTNEVKMPDAASFQFRVGYRGKQWGGEAIVSNWTTLGGFDITRNNMPFPSNKMNATIAGIALKCNPRALPGLVIMAGGNYTVAGRNVGQALMLDGGLSYVIDFTHKTKKSK